ncbi:MAG: lysine decarboxylase, partial [Rhodobacteraceae bacterium]|nr:lysine decarboxylase [Paracoccaceae bacterium]
MGRSQHTFPNAEADMDQVSKTPDTPQTRAPTYRLAFSDPDFLCRDELRATRIQLEMMKPELIL